MKKIADFMDIPFFGLIWLLGFYKTSPDIYFLTLAINVQLVLSPPSPPQSLRPKVFEGKNHFQAIPSDICADAAKDAKKKSSRGLNLTKMTSHWVF